MSIRTTVCLRNGFWASMSAISILNVSGCSAKAGPERATVSGTVTFDREPLENGLIAFIPDGATQGPTAAAAIQKGKYATPAGTGPVLGTHRVEITAHRTGRVIEGAGIGGGVGPSDRSDFTKFRLRIAVFLRDDSARLGHLASSFSKGKICRFGSMVPSEGRDVPSFSLELIP